MTPSECPGFDQLQALNSGFLEDGVIDRIADHLDTCFACRELLETLRSGIFSGTPSVPADIDEFTDEPEFQSGITRLNAICGESNLSDSAPSPAELNPAPQQSAQLLPSAFGRYRILETLGEGGMGVVYHAYDSQLERHVALKIPRFSTLPGQEIIDRFYRESRAAAKLEHPNLCPVFDVGELDGVQYLVMAYIPGQRLSDLSQGDQLLTIPQVVSLVRKIALALEEAHQHGVVHRDLKPSNIMLNKRGEPVVMDFGLAQLTHGNRPENNRLTLSGIAIGTPAYMPPEQVTGNLDEIGPASDIYSLGVILYELLVGRLPFEGSVTAVLARIMVEDPIPPAQLRPEVDPQLEAICLKAMARGIADRFSSMAQFADALNEWLHNSQDIGLTSSVAPGDSSEPSPSHRLPRWSLVSLAGGIAVALVAGLLLYQSLTNQGELLVEISSDQNATEVRNRLDREGLMIFDIATGRTYTINSQHQRRLPSARYKVRNPHGLSLVDQHASDVTFREFDIGKNHSTKLTVTLSPESIQETEPLELTDEKPTSTAGDSQVATSPSADPDRKLAEWVLSLQGTLQVDLGGKDLTLRPPMELPQGTFRVRHVDLANQIEVDDSGLANLRDTRIRSLNLVGTRITDQGLLQLQGQIGLDELWLGETRIGDEGVKHLRQLVNIGRLFLFGTQITDDAIPHLKALPSLHSLMIHRTAVSDRGLLEVCELKNLESLAIGRTQITAAGLAPLSNLPKLKILSLEGSTLEKTGLEHLQRIPKLRELALHGAAFSEEVLVHLPERLKILGLGNTPLTDDGLRHLERLTDLETLGIPGTQVTETGLRRLREKLPRLKIQR